MKARLGIAKRGRDLWGSVLEDAVRVLKWSLDEADSDLKIPEAVKKSYAQREWTFDPSSVSDRLRYAHRLFAYASDCAQSATTTSPSLFADVLGNLALAHQCIGYAYGLAGAKLADSEMRRKWARLRHEETYRLKGEILEYWRANIDPRQSAEKAATKLERQFPISHRKLAEYVAGEKRKIRAASKA